MSEPQSTERTTDMVRNLKTKLLKYAIRGLRFAKSSQPIYLAVFVIVCYALWDARTPVTMIAPFQVPNNKLSFTGDIVADSVQDALKSIRNEIEAEKQDMSLRSSETGLPDLRNMLMPTLWQVQAPPRFTVEVKGVSYGRILTVAREILGTETTISGDVVMEGEKFILIARAPDGGPWESSAQPLSPDGLKQASGELAVQILMTQDPTLAGVALLKHGHIDEGLEELIRARNRKPADPGLTMNLCVGFASSRRYDDAIECYEQVLQRNPNSADIKERLAQAYYLKGLRDDAIQLYEELVYRYGYRQALLGLGEARDDRGESQSAVNAYDKFLETESQDRNKAIAHVKKGLALAHLGNHKDALNEYHEALNYAPGDVLILVHAALERANAGDIDCGIAELRTVVSENQNSESLPFARVQLGVLLERTLDWKGAVEQYELAALEQPNYVEAHHKLAGALLHKNQVTRALDEYGKAARLSSSDVERGNADKLAQLWLANGLRDQHNPDAASAYRKAILLKSDNSAAHCQLSLILTSQGHLSEAIREYGLASVPAKLPQFSDAGCLSDLGHLLDHAVAIPGPGRARAIADLHKVRQEIQNNEKDAVLAKAENAQRPS